ncbi:MAG: TaqI-like C-terminal specificity domain-containing protein, partial [Thermodesulfobacteriota bacterium]
VLGYITSNKWMKSNYGKTLRKYLTTNTNPLLLINLGSRIFESANVDSNVLITEKNTPKNIHLRSNDLSKTDEILEVTTKLNDNNQIKKSSDDIWIISGEVEYQIINKIEKKGSSISNWNIEVYRGIVTGLTEAYVINNKKRNELIEKDAKIENVLEPLLIGRNIKRYLYQYQGLYLINTHNGYDNPYGEIIERIKIDEFPRLKEYLDEFEPKLSKRYDKGVTPYNLRNCAYVDNFRKNKIIYPDIGQELSFTLDNDSHFLTNTSYFLDTDNKYLLSVLNSKLINFYYKNISAQLGAKGIRHFTIYIKNIPIPKISADNQGLFIMRVEKILDLNSKLGSLLDSFIEHLKFKFSVAQFSNKLNDWHKLEFKDFLKELKKKKVKLSLSEEAEWMNYFNEQRAKALEIKAEINKTDKEIDQMVYELYELTPEEIRIVEGS